MQTTRVPAHAGQVSYRTGMERAYPTLFPGVLHLDPFKLCLRGAPLVGLPSSRISVPVSVFTGVPSVQVMDAKFSQLPNMLRSAAVPAQGEPVGSSVAQQAARQGTGILVSARDSLRTPPIFLTCRASR